jgi:hypothetical protein
MKFLRLSMTMALAAAIWAAGGDGPALQLKWLDANPTVGRNGALAVEMTGVNDLDAYSFDIAYDTAALSMVDAALDAPLLNVRNPLRNNAQTLLPVIKKEPGRVTIAATLAGTAPDEPAGFTSGVFGVVVFKILRDPIGAVAVQKARLLDQNGHDIANVTIVPTP